MLGRIIHNHRHSCLLDSSDLFINKTDELLDGGEGVSSLLRLLDESCVCSWTNMFGGGIMELEHVHGGLEGFLIDIRRKNFFNNGFHAFTVVQQCIASICRCATAYGLWLKA